MVRGDEDLLSTALTNLLDNARKFALHGAPVTADLCLAAGCIRFRVTSPGARVRAEERELVFERFYRGAEARATANGHGLGLPLCRHIARLHGGEARCVSAADEDACFVLELPAWAPQKID
jgi:two-component system sensor histidine kinase SenX3